MESHLIDTTPVGTVVAFAGPKNKIPANWIVCDGVVYNRNAKIPIINVPYQLLFNAIGTSWGGAGVDTFAVPDLRGLFLRGVADNSDIDAEKNERAKSRPDLNGSGNGGNDVGSKQSDQFASHTHPLNPAHAFMDNDSNTNSVEGGDGVNYGRSAMLAGAVGGSETRPKNAYVYYIIKAV